MDVLHEKAHGHTLLWEAERALDIYTDTEPAFRTASLRERTLHVIVCGAGPEKLTGYPVRTEFRKPDAPQSSLAAGRRDRGSAGDHQHRASGPPGSPTTWC
jgi:hypothetical protein